MSAYRDHEDLISVGAYRRGSNRVVDAAIDLRDEINGFLRQDVGQRSTVDDSRAGLLRLQQLYAQRTGQQG
jgi:flagellum-specific ATP synthase